MCGAASMERHVNTLKTFTVRCEWDEDARVWYVSESNLPGLAAEGETVDEVIGKLHTLVPELVALNAHLLPEGQGADIPVSVVAQRLERLRIAG